MPFISWEATHTSVTRAQPPQAPGRRVVPRERLARGREGGLTKRGAGLRGAGLHGTSQTPRHSGLSDSVPDGEGSTFSCGTTISSNSTGEKSEGDFSVYAHLYFLYFEPVAL